MSYDGKECPAGLIELCNALKQEIEDERNGSSKYREASAKFAHYGLDKMAKKVREMAEDEFMHSHILEAIIENISKKCKCDPNPCGRKR